MWGLIKLNPWKYVGILIGLLAAIAAVITAANVALGHAKQAGRDEIQARWDAEKAGAAMASAKLSNELTERLSSIDTDLQAGLATIHSNGAAITVHVDKELHDDPRYSSPDCALSDGVRGQVNAARGLSSSTPAGGGHGSPVPPGSASGGQHDR